MRALLLLLWLTLGGGVATPAQEPPEPVVRTATAGPVRLVVELDRASLRIDDRLRLAVRVDAPADFEIAFPDLAGELDDFAVIGRESAPPGEAAAGVRTWAETWLLEPEGVGELTLPALAVTYRRSDGAAAELATEPLTVAVLSVLPDDADIFSPKDIAPPVALADPRPPLWLWLAAGLPIAVALTGWIGWRRRRRASRPAAPAPPAHLLALERLDRLQREGLIEGGRVQEFHVALAGILRHYALWRFGLRAPSQTTEELLAGIARLDGPITAERGAIAALLAACDRVKFARHRPAPDAMHDALRAARTFVERTADPAVLVSDPAAV